ncbi:fimbria/pilus outer membrane usher protein [Candidatus Regiella insecticola]|uniref:fimbria/pilus outer membrane usher protein n=1 Tax=Candidatus Regiella insecticola TaxID=138073 RepID=UPI00159642D6|nr:fimbria/pilus outer membrane usher protein [Candidatus Regiella insecticola]
MQLGVGKGFGHWGSLSVDVTQANTTRADRSTYQGQSYRIQYAKALEATNTSFRLAGYHYSTAGYYDFQESHRLDNHTHFNYNKRNRAQIDVSQSLGNYGNVYLSGAKQDYWRLNGSETSLSAGYNTSYRGVSYGISYTHSQRPDSRQDDQQLALNVSLSLSDWLSNSSANYGATHQKGGNTSHRLGLSGSALANNKLSYNFQQSYTPRGNSNGASLSGSYRGQYGSLNGGYNYNQSGSSLNYGLQGGVVAHPYGVTLSQPLGETATLVRAPGASNVKVQNGSSVATDWRGYAVVPSANAYRVNQIRLDTQSLGDNVDVEHNTQTVVPTQGALVLANFNTRVGSRVLMTLHYQSKPIPFGATATLVESEGSSENSSIVGAEGQVYLSGVPDRGQLNLTCSGVRKASSNAKLILRCPLPRTKMQRSGC